MTFPLDLFITPYNAAPKSSLEGANLLGQAGDAMQKERLAKMQYGQTEAHFQQNQQLQNRELQSLDRYRQDQIDSRRDAMRDKDQLTRERRVQQLLAELRKAKPFSKEREMIRQELTSLGQSVEESDTELPQTETQSPIVSPIDIAPPIPKKQIMGNADPFGPGTPAVKEEERPDDPDDPFGLAAPKAPPAPGVLGIAPDKPKRGGKFTVRDEKGNLVMAYDEPVEKERSRGSMKNILGPIVTGARSKEEKAAAQAALDAATGAVESGGYTTKEAADYGRQIYKDEMGRYKTERRPGSVPAGGASSGPSKEARIRMGALSDDTLKTVDTISKSRQIPDVHKTLSSVSRMQALLQDADTDPDGFKQHAAMSQYLKEISGAQVSDKERADIFGGAGKQEYWLNEINKYTNGGRMPGGLIRGLRDVAERARGVLQGRIDAAQKAAEVWIDKAPSLATPEEKEQQKEAARGFFGGDGGAAPSGGGTQSGGRKRAEEWLKRQK